MTHDAHLIRQSQNVHSQSSPGFKFTNICAREGRKDGKAAANKSSTMHLDLEVARSVHRQWLVPVPSWVAKHFLSSEKLLLFYYILFYSSGLLCVDIPYAQVGAFRLGGASLGVCTYLCTA